MKKLNVALVGLSFGLEFVAIYCKHPDIDTAESKRIYLIKNTFVSPHKKTSKLFLTHII